MRKIVFSLIYMLLSVASAQTQSFVDAGSLPAYMLGQSDPLFYSQGVIATTSGTSSLCGPTSVMNWLQLRHQNAYSKIQLVNFVQVIGQDLRAEQIEINNGLTGHQLLRFLEIYGAYLEEDTTYALRSQKDIPLTDLLNEKPQLLLLRYNERPRFMGPGGNRRDDFKVPVFGAHWVLKMGANSLNSEIFVIDPENPNRITTLIVEEKEEQRVKIFRLTPKTKEDLTTFAFRVPLIWSLTSLIEEKN